MGDRMNAMPGDTIRADLSARIAALDMRARHARPSELARDLDAIRRIAQTHNMTPAISVAHMLGSALARGERGPLIRAWIGILGDAVGSERFDAQACDAYAAACSVRLAG